MKKQTRGSEFGEMLKDARLKSGLTNEAFAAMLKLPYATLYRYENGWFIPTLDKADRILKKLGLSLTIGRK